MTENPIVEEVHRIRERMLEKFGGDLEALMKDAQRRTEEAARAVRKIVVPPAYPPDRYGAASKKAG